MDRKVESMKKKLKRIVQDRTEHFIVIFFVNPTMRAIQGVPVDRNILGQ